MKGQVVVVEEEQERRRARKRVGRRRRRAARLESTRASGRAGEPELVSCRLPHTYSLASLTLSSSQYLARPWYVSSTEMSGVQVISLTPCLAHP